MRLFTVALFLSVAVIAGEARAGMGGGTQPKESWDDMQTLEYDIGRIAWGLNICRYFSMSREMQEIASLSPYGKLGMDKMRGIDYFAGAACSRISKSAKNLLGDKAKLMDYLKAKYDCSSGTCVER